ncbi:uncharacterized protein I206_106945 [Kwoniella pini CBS 10737]|uniref:Uncharacterized protein n=1 Tax=Kwoniella pini CBS 10737 TaxID=1296096 RepID=A0A1B9HZS3_9TREE|nr:uncharacterized protein I206_05512 [Kwoniella pini CBS 10737]OCF48731.1 hypothetical protein I206_05512 [Kwoniella pini CBS 10737]
MLLSIILSLISVQNSVYAAPAYLNPSARQSESHKVTLVNNCGSGEPVYVYEGNKSPSGSSTTIGPVKGGLAWLKGASGIDCRDNGLNCGLVEFTLTNSQGGSQNSADYSLLDGVDDQLGTSLGNHKFQYSMDFEFNGCKTTQKYYPCLGDSAEACPGGFLDSSTKGGSPIQCLADNVGITITFCPSGGLQPNDAADPAGGISASNPSNASATSQPAGGIPSGALTSTGSQQTSLDTIVPPAGTAVTTVSSANSYNPATTAPSVAIPTYGTANPTTSIPTSADPFDTEPVRPNGAGSVADYGLASAALSTVVPCDVTTSIPSSGVIVTSVPGSQRQSQKPNWGINHAWTRGFE